LVGIFTRPTSNDEFKYCGYVSNRYKFVGNEVLNRRIRESINEVGLPILHENAILNYTYTKMRNEIIISNSHNIPQVGDVLPVLIVSNSYDGTGAECLSFGIGINENSNRYVFSFNMGEMRQIHITNSPTAIKSAVSTYSQVFTENIAELITGSFNKQVTPQEMLSLLDIVETLGKKRRDKLSEILSKINTPEEGKEPSLPSAWQVFLALVRYTSLEPNLNMKKFLESAAERVLVIPKRMFDALDKINGQEQE
jgi:hypothetical protein